MHFVQLKYAFRTQLVNVETVKKALHVVLYAIHRTQEVVFSLVNLESGLEISIVVKYFLDFFKDL